MVGVCVSAGRELCVVFVVVEIDEAGNVLSPGSRCVTASDELQPRG